MAQVHDMKPTEYGKRTVKTKPNNYKQCYYMYISEI